MSEQIIQRTIPIDIGDEMQKSFLDYSMSVIVSRALPDVRDGLKPVHRRILYTLFENGILPDKPYRKCADTVGSVLGKYHPHGDSSVYDALVRLAQDFSMRYTLIDGHGNFGSVDGDPAAAYRYTEAKLAKLSMGLLQDIDKDTIDMTPNFDDRLMEPTVLPSRFPNLLVNGSQGIAVGMATNIPPHNLGEIVDGINILIDNPDATLDELMTAISGPDFPTGGVIMGTREIRSAYGTGRGKIILRAVSHIEEMGNNRERIVVTEIPYGVNKARLVESIDRLVKDKRIDQISYIRDESDREGMRIVMELKRDANTALVLNQLYSYSQMQETVGVIMLALVDGVPKVLTLKEMLSHYLSFQEEVIVRRTTFDLKKAKERSHVLEGLKIALDFIDEVIALIRKSPNQSAAKLALEERFGLTEIQSAAIVAMRLGQLSGLERDKIEGELAEIKLHIADLEDILANRSRVLNIIKEEMGVYATKYADKRRTAIQFVSGEVDIEDLIPVAECVITMTHLGYVKRQLAENYKIQKRGGRGIIGMKSHDEDFIKDIFSCSTHDYIMFFTTRGRVYRIKGYEIAESSRTGKGTSIVNLLPLEAGEKVTSAIKMTENDNEGYMVMVTKNGIIKRSDISYFQNVRKNGLIAIGLNDNDELAFVEFTDGNSDIILATKLGMSIRFNENDARELGRTARGVKAIKLGEEDHIVGAISVKTDEEGTVLTISEKGLGRRSNIEEYRIQSRGGKGTINYKTSKNGPVAGITKVVPTEDVILISDDGIIIRINPSDISVQSRYGGGVRVMRIGEDAKVVTMTKTAREQNADDEEIEGELNSEAGDNIESGAAENAANDVSLEGEEA